MGKNLSRPRLISMLLVMKLAASHLHRQLRLSATEQTERVLAASIQIAERGLDGHLADDLDSVWPIVRAAKGLITSPLLNDQLHIAWWSNEAWDAMPLDSQTLAARSRIFSQLARLGGGIHILEHEPMNKYPTKLLRLSFDYGFADEFLHEAVCMFDDLS